MSKSLISILLFGYFGYIIIPQWFRPLSPQFIFLAIALPVVLIVLVVTGIRGGIGLWREKVQKTPPNPEYKFFVWLAGLSILWFFISIALANVTHFAYNHQKFDSKNGKLLVGRMEVHSGCHHERECLMIY